MCVRVIRGGLMTAAVIGAMVAGSATMAEAGIQGNTFGGSGELSARGHRVEVTVLLACSHGSSRFTVTLQQDDTIGTGHGAGVCTGDLEQYAVTVTAGSATFEPGAATLCGDAINRERGGTTDTRHWCRASPLTLS
jgi:hypothetical protein